MTTKAPFSVEVDVGRNFACMCYSGNITAAEMKTGAQQVEALLPQLRAGFTVLADLSGLELMDLDCGPHIAKMMDLCKARGVSLVVRVIPDPKKDIGLNILSMVHYRGKVRIVTCETLAEAEKLLN